MLPSTDDTFKEPLYCEWLWHAVTVRADGSVTCGLSDPFKVRNYGSLHTSTLQEILSAKSIAERRHALESGTRCKFCDLHTSRANTLEPDLIPSSPYPRRLVLEPTIRCNIRCNNDTCNIANDHKVRLRDEPLMPWDMYCRLIDEVGPHLKELYFFNYGEPFLHPRALDMLAYAKAINPSIYVVTSTNGILLAREGGAERIVEEGLVDWICFTVSGVDQSTYSRYHRSGSFDQAMLAMRRMAQVKRSLGKSNPWIHWRYLLFNWNDSDECITKALRMHQDLGADELKFMLTSSPLEGRSLQRAPGTPGFDAIKPWLAYQNGYAPDAFREAGLWGAQRSPYFGEFSWTGSLAKIGVRVLKGRINIRLACPQLPRSQHPNILIRMPWGAEKATAGRFRWRSNEYAVPKMHAAESIPVVIEVDKLYAPRRDGKGTGGRHLGVMVALRDMQPTPNPHRTSETPVAVVSDASAAWRNLDSEPMRGSREQSA